VTDVLGQILPLAVAVSISPVQIIAVILLLFSERPKANAGALVAGFVVGVAFVLTLLVLVASTQDLTSGSDGSTGVAWGRMALGVILLVAAVRKFRGRPGPDDPPAMPSWMEGMQSFSPGRSLVTGLGLGAANPKMIAMALAAAATIATAGLSTGDDAIVIAVYTVIGAIGVAAPLVVAVAMGDRAAPVLDGWRDWLAHHNAAVMAVLFLVFGVVLIGQGLQTL
jgi:threonine/homoserine/homoserine lactone efflux protein